MRVLAFVSLAMIVGACMPAPSPDPTTGSPEPTPVEASIIPPSSPSLEPTASSGAVTFEDGEHRVGHDVQPGTYRAAAANVGDGFCFWERVSGFGGTEGETIANAAGVGPRVVTIASTDVGFVSDDCGTWSSDLSPLQSPVGDGVWIVGVDVEPGAYTSDGGPSCVWQRVSGFGGTDGESIEVGLTGEVEIRRTDAGFVSSNCGTWELQSD